MSTNDALPLSPDDIAKSLKPFEVQLTAPQLEAVRTYIRLLLFWNKALSLTSIDDLSEIVARHFGESIFACKKLGISHGRLADVGAGAGFPGLPIKIAAPRVDLSLIESNRKKCAFLREVKRDLSLTEVSILSVRYEQLSAHSAGGTFDWICSRAVGGHKQILHWAKNMLLSHTGRVVFWISIEDSLAISSISGWAWDTPIKVPESRGRILLSGKVAAT